MNDFPDLYIAATVASALALSTIGAMLLLRTEQRERSFLWVLMSLMLPMNAIAFYGVRIPVDAWLSPILADHPAWLKSLKLFYAPLTEEPAKLCILLIPWVYSRIDSANIVRVAIAIGLGFGVGEAWTVARLLSASPETAALPWYQLSGYMGERLMVCIIHAGFTVVALRFIVAGKGVLLGLVASMLLHLIANLPVFLAKTDVLNIGGSSWAVIMPLWVLACFFLACYILGYLAYGKRWSRRVFKGKMTCPGCKCVYVRPLFKINLLHKCYEKCPHCKLWHLVNAFSDEEDQQELTGDE